MNNSKPLTPHSERDRDCEVMPRISRERRRRFGIWSLELGVRRQACFSAAAVALAACGGRRLSESPQARLDVDLPPRWEDLYAREKPMFQVQDPHGPNVYYVFSLRLGRVVMTRAPDIGYRPATPEESDYALGLYEALHQLPPAAQDAAPVEARRVERADTDIDPDLLARMDRTIAMWEGEKRDLEIKLEAARAAKYKVEEEKLLAMIAELDGLIADHRLKKQIYTSAEWKEGRLKPPAATTLRAADRPEPVLPRVTPAEK